MKKIMLLFLSLAILGCSSVFAYDAVRCTRCDTRATWTGRTEYDWGHTLLEYKCLNNHVFLVRQH